VHRRSRFAAVATAALFALVAMSQAVSAAPKDAAAKKLDKDAMETDFLNANFDAAEKKLKDAVKTCDGKDACTPKIKAQILVHLGIIQVNLSKKDDAEKAFVDGLKIDNSVAPESDYVSPDVEKVFKEAKAKAAGGAATPPPDKTGGGTEPTSPPGELEHEQVKEQMVETPVPLFVGIPEGMKVAKVIVMYRPFGAEEWKKLELKKAGNGYAGEIPCEETGTTGDLKYYIKAVDSGGDPIAEVGSKNKPMMTKIKNQLEGEPPHLPDKAPPAKCQGKGTCPPDFPGCKETAQCGSGGWGASCGRDKDCQCNYHCKKEEGKDEGTCEEGAPGAGTGDEAGGGSKAPFKKNWLTLTFSPDIAILSGSDICSASAQKDNGYSCFRNDQVANADQYNTGTQYHGTPKGGNAIQTGVAFSTVRIMAGYDRTLGANFQVGVRLGFAFLGGPKPEGGNAFLPFHGEVRGSYWFGQNPFAKVGLRPFVFLGVGMAQVDSKVQIPVTEDPALCNGPRCEVFSNNVPVQQNPTNQKLDAWHKAGQQFVGLGGGVMYAVTPKAGIVGALKYMQMFPTAGSIISPEISGAFAF
jgi:hypothetical protein